MPTMNAKLLAAGALAAALLIAGVPLGTSSATAGTAKKIMLAGDSITQGRNGDYTWRYRFAMELKRQGVSNVDLVGPNRYPHSFGSSGVHHYLASGWDADHDAVSGTTLSAQVGSIGGQVATYQPDILVSFLGTNDLMEIARKYPSATSAQLLPLYRQRIDEMIANWKLYISKARAAKSGLEIVLGEVVAPEVPVEIRDEYNADLADVARDSSVLQKPVVLAQLAGSIWSSPQYLYDGLHPTPTAETQLAQKFAEAINEAEPGFFPSEIKIQRAYVPWNPPLQTKIVVTGRRLNLSWAYTATANTVTKMRVKVTTVRSGSQRLGAFQSATRWKSQPLKPGTYRLSIQGSRGSMTSTWSPAILVKITKSGSKVKY